MRVVAVLTGVIVAGFMMWSAIAVGWWALDQAATCHQHGRAWGVVSQWSPFEGCTTTILGTKVYL